VRYRLPENFQPLSGSRFEIIFKGIPMSVKSKNIATKKIKDSTANDGLAQYTKAQKEFAKRQADSNLEKAGSYITKANDILYEAGLIKGELIR